MIRLGWQDGECNHCDELGDEEKDVAMLGVVFGTKLIRNDEGREKTHTKAKRYVHVIQVYPS